MLIVLDRAINFSTDLESMILLNYNNLLPSGLDEILLFLGEWR